MDANLELLVELQQIDDEITELDAQIKAFPEQVSQHGSALAAAKAEYDGFRKRLDDANKERLQKEKGVEEKNAAIAKARMKLNEVKTNQEYHAALHEIENMKGAIGKLEEEQLEIMEKLDSAKSDEKSFKERVAAEEKDFAVFKAQKEAEVGKLKTEADHHRARRAELTAKIPAALLSHYDRIFSVRENKAVAELKNGYCMACHQMVLPQLALEVRMGTTIHKCPHCLRYLYPAHEEKKAEASH
ncbi:MAG: hypothetical protein HZA04_08525 [Nitrospinae bacterium]|nr:hypothetical protein [Nitrospinota bacterium]